MQVTKEPLFFTLTHACHRQPLRLNSVVSRRYL